MSKIDKMVVELRQRFGAVERISIADSKRLDGILSGAPEALLVRLIRARVRFVRSKAALVLRRRFGWSVERVTDLLLDK